MSSELWLRRFVVESNRIEGIFREPSPAEIAATEAFISLDKIGVEDVKAIVSAYQPSAVIRDRGWINVRVGDHIAPPGGASIVDALEVLLGKISDAADAWSPWVIHVEYETLHPFSDGNGRSGRAIWLWHMLHIGGRYELQAKELGFLHAFYYQTLERSR